MQPVLFWFRRNLRLADNDALIAAATTGRPVIAVYVVDSHDAGRASRWWLHHSLAGLDRDLRRLGSSLVLRVGEPENVLSGLASQYRAVAIYYSKRHELTSRKQEQALADVLSPDVQVYAFGDSLLHDPDRVRTATGSRYRIFTPFWRAASRDLEAVAPRPAPPGEAFARLAVDGPKLSDLLLVPGGEADSRSWRDAWMPGEAAALDKLDGLESKLTLYKEWRDVPDKDATSMLSPHLHFGEVSPRQVHHALLRQDLQLSGSAGAEALLRQLWWREFSYYLLHHWPQLPERSLRDEFENFPWLDRDEDLRAWQQGRTGYPIVDAGMRQLRETGWMHNRVRMVAASLLVKHLLVPWQKGAAWFLDNLVDADLACNSANWQWVAGCGTDAAPYFRVFNPELQARKFDPHGRYVRQWVPDVDDDRYPPPIVDHIAASRRALETYQAMKGRRTSNRAP